MYTHLVHSHITNYQYLVLFLIFINDVADNMTDFGRLFADETCIGHIAHNEENLHTLISTDLEYLNAWSYRWLVKFDQSQ